MHVPEQTETGACVKERPSLEHAGSPRSILGLYNWRKKEATYFTVFFPPLIVSGGLFHQHRSEHGRFLILRHACCVKLLIDTFPYLNIQNGKQALVTRNLFIWTMKKLQCWECSGNCILHDENETRQ